MVLMRALTPPGGGETDKVIGAYDYNYYEAIPVIYPNSLRGR